MWRNRVRADERIITIQIDAGHGRVVRGLRQNVDGAAHEVLRERLGLESVHGQDPNFQAQTALLQIATGEKEKGLATLDALLAEGAMPDMVWDLLIQQDPAAAEARLRQALNGETIDEDEARVRIVHALQSQGRNEEALGEVQLILEQDPDNAWGIETLGQLDGRRALAWLEGRLAVTPSAELQALYGEQLLRAERTQEGIGALLQAWELEPDAGYGLRLLELIPDRVAPRLLQQAAAPNNDELYGDIADALWQLGRRQEAEGHWRTALRIDPTDSEWIEKLRAVGRGRDPMQ